MSPDRAASNGRVKGRAPFKIVADEEPGAADVVDRATGYRIGYLRTNYYRQWAAYLSCAAGNQLVFGTRPVEDRYREIFHTDNEPVLFTKYRKDAAAKVWETWKELQDG